MTQMMGGLNSRGCAGRPLPRDFGHFASPSWLTMKKSTMYKMKMANEGKKEKKHQEKLECPGISSMYE